MESGVEGIGEVEPLDEKQAGAQAAETAPADFMGDIAVDVAVREEAGTLLLPAPLAETILDAVLAIDQTFLYCGTHLKSFAHCGFLASFLSCYYSQVPRDFKVRARTLPRCSSRLACFRSRIACLIGKAIARAGMISVSSGTS